jgi:hippurate hydrolase
VGQVFDEGMILRKRDMRESGIQEKNGGSEDFAVIAQKVPSVFFAVAAGNSQEGFVEPLHSPRVRFDENALAYGVAAMCAFALQGNGEMEKGE